MAKKYSITPEYITNLKLQKLLYFVQAFSLLIFNKKAFSEKIIVSSDGPIVNEVYQIYKQNQNRRIVNNDTIKPVSTGLSKIIDEVIDGYRIMEAGQSSDFTHEEPWKNTKINDEMDIEKIKEYFHKVYNN